MPCYDERSEPRYVRAEAEREWVHNSPVAELLCEAMKVIEVQRVRPMLSLKLEKWWKDHQKRDRNK